MKFFEKRRKAKLYRQWVERAGLASEVVPHEDDKPEGITRRVPGFEAGSPEVHEPPVIPVEPDRGAATTPEVAGDMLAEINRRQRRLPTLYMLLGAAALILCVGLILLIVYSC